jgi:O-antigen ligase
VSVNAPTGVRNKVRSSPRLLEWAVTLYVASTIIEGAAFSFGQSRISRLAAIALVLVMLGYAVSGRIPRVSNPSLIGIFGVFALVAASSFWTEAPEQTTARLVTFGALAVTSAALAAALACLEDSGVRCIARGLIIGAIVASVLVVVSRARGDYAGVDEFQRLTERSSAGAADPNDLALLLAVALPACLWSRRWQVRYPVAALTITAIFFTGSRGAIASLAIGAVAAILVIVLARRQSLRKLIQSSAVAAAAIWVAWILLPESLVGRIEGIPGELASGTFTNRTSLWQAAWEQFSENPFFGTGAGTVRDFIYQRTGIDLVAHNAHLSFLVELGLAGWLLFILALSAAWAGAIRSSRSAGWLVVSMSILTTGTLMLSWEYNKLLWVMLIMGGTLLSTSHRTVPLGPFLTGPSRGHKERRRGHVSPVSTFERRLET